MFTQPPNLGFIPISDKDWGSGFVFKKDLVFTCAHVVGKQEEVKFQTSHGTHDAKVLHIYPDRDIAILKIRPPDGAMADVFYPTLQVSIVHHLNEKKEFTAWGYGVSSPAGRVANLSEGKIISKARYLQLRSNGDVRQGMSGGPVITTHDGRNYVVGILTFNVPAKEYGGVLEHFAEHFSDLTFNELAALGSPVNLHLLRFERKGISIRRLMEKIQLLLLLACMLVVINGFFGAFTAKAGVLIVSALIFLAGAIQIFVLGHSKSMMKIKIAVFARKLKSGLNRREKEK